MGPRQGKEPERESGGLHRQQRKQLCHEEGDVHKVPTDVVGHGACKNQGADDLTNEEFGKFDMNKRIQLRGEGIKWKVLKELVEGSLQLYEEVRKMKEDHAEGCTEETSFKEERWKKIQEDPGEVVATEWQIGRSLEAASGGSVTSQNKLRDSLALA